MLFPKNDRFDRRAIGTGPEILAIVKPYMNQGDISTMLTILQFSELKILTECVSKNSDFVLLSWFYVQFYELI